MEVLKRLGQTLGRMVDSTKLVLAIATAIAGALAHWGLNVPVEVLVTVVTPVVAAILGRSAVEATANLASRPAQVNVTEITRPSVN
jgi:hypothetical protein